MVTATMGRKRMVTMTMVKKRMMITMGRKKMTMMMMERRRKRRNRTTMKRIRKTTIRKRMERARGTDMICMTVRVKDRAMNMSIWMCTCSYNRDNDGSLQTCVVHCQVNHVSHKTGQQRYKGVCIYIYYTHRHN